MPTLELKIVLQHTCACHAQACRTNVSLGKAQGKQDPLRSDSTNAAFTAHYFSMERAQGKQERHFVHFTNDNCLSVDVRCCKLIANN